MRWRQFQFTPLREGRPAGQSAMGNRNDFNSRPSARGDAVGGISYYVMTISIHAPPRGATICLQNIPACINFNSRPSARSDREAHPMAEAIGKFQFTPLREGRPCRVR